MSEAVNIFSHPSSTGRRAVPMGIKTGGMRHIINRLTDFYTDPILGMVREVLSNAIDATKAAGGTPAAIEVNTPSVYNHFFKVTDHGTGMTTKQLEEDYAQYGSEGKSSALDQIGEFGLGAKSPLAYATEFSVETTRDGVTTWATIARTDEGPILYLDTERESCTGKPNGTTVTIPVQPSHEDLARFSQVMDSYRHLNFDVPMDINGERYFGNPNYIELGSLTLEEGRGITGRVWVNRRDLVGLLSMWFCDDPINPADIGYVLSGYMYHAPGASWTRGEPSLLVELKPRVVDFVSSRDGIVANGRFARLEQLVHGYLDPRRPSLSRAILDRVLPVLEPEPLRTALRLMVPTMDPSGTVTFPGPVTVPLASMRSMSHLQSLVDLADHGTQDVYHVLVGSSRGGSSWAQIHLGKDTNILAEAGLHQNGDHGKPHFSHCSTATHLNQWTKRRLNWFLDSDPEGHPISPVQAAHHINGFPNSHVYVVQDAHTAQNLGKVLRARELLRKHSKGDVTLLLMGGRDLGEDERGAILRALSQDAEMVHFVHVADITRLVEEARKEAKEDVTTQYISVFDLGELDSVDTLLDLVKPRRSNVLPSSLAAANALVVMTMDRHCSLPQVQSTWLGYLEACGAEKTLGRPVYAMGGALKADLEALQSAGVEMIFPEGYAHASALGRSLASRTYTGSLHSVRLDRLPPEEIEENYLRGSEMWHASISLRWDLDTLDSRGALQGLPTMCWLLRELRRMQGDDPRKQKNTLLVSEKEYRSRVPLETQETNDLALSMVRGVKAKRNPRDYSPNNIWVWNSRMVMSEDALSDFPELHRNIMGTLDNWFASMR